MPTAARAVVVFFSLPGILLAILSLLLLAVSMLALLVLTVPVYRLFTRPSGGGREAGESVAAAPFSVTFGDPAEVASPGTRRVDSTVVE